MKKSFITLASLSLSLAGCQQSVEISEWTVLSRDSYFQKVEANVAEKTADAQTICICLGANTLHTILLR